MREQALEYILKTILPELQARNIKLHLDFENDYVIYENNLPCSGYFDDKKQILACAIGNKNIEDWFGTFIHEYCHFKQWVEQCDAWTNSQPSDSSSDDLLDRFLAGETIDNIEEVIKNICYLEYDCEVRTSKVIERFPEIFNKELYIQKSNAYIAFYREMIDRKQWYDPTKAPYLNKDIYNNMPKTFIEFSNYFENYAFKDINWDACFKELK